MKCIKCGKVTSKLTTFMNINAKEVSYICDKCTIENIINNFNVSNLEKIEKLDKEIKKFQEIYNDFNKLLSEYPNRKKTKVPPELEAIAFTPERVMTFNKSLLIEFNKKRNDLISELSEKEYLIYQLKQTLKTENYEQAAIYRDRLKKIENNKK